MGWQLARDLSIEWFANPNESSNAKSEPSDKPEKTTTNDLPQKSAARNMKTTKSDSATLSRTIWSVALVGVAMVIVAAFVGGGRAAFSVFVGSATGVANLVVIGILVRKLISGTSRLPWGAVSFVKLVVLFGGLFLLLKTGVVQILPLVIGYGALPLGITFGQRPIPQTADEEG